ncbi:flagella assembly protein FlgT [Oceanobacter mangrovi]|uniref:flagella assembly protein FlgT n=1 Tax=Oceanobacter mangrovi TaxID=2862510 RepID=UPI001C8DD4B2|nr:flagella assembly protein FlgT [Oceanobacter mangrovi]
MKRLKLTGLALGALIVVNLASVSQARTVEVSGQAVIGQSVNQAREEALKDALRQASLQAGASIRSTQMLTGNEMDQDEIQLRSQARIRNVDVIEEGEYQGLYEVSLKVDVEPEAMCAATEQHYRKAIAIAGFGLARPMQATLGQLQNIEQDLPRLLVNQLNRGRFIQALDATRISLYQDPRRAPSLETSQQRLTTSVALATQLGAQYVVSGVVRELGEAQSQGRVAPAANGSWAALVGLEKAPPQREFVAELFIHDGLSGAMLFQRSYETKGAWTPKPNAMIGFGTPAFWQTPYGGQVDNLMAAMVEDIGEVIRCQPFMARIVASRGNRLHIEASAAAGLRPGDKLQVYRTGTFYNLDLEPRTELTDMATEVVVKQVQPQFVIAEMSADAGSLAIQRDDLVIAW